MNISKSKFLVFICFFALFFFIHTLTISSQDTNDEKWKRDYWLKKYGEVRSDSNNIAKRAHQVFERLLLIADKRKGVEIQFFIINHKGTPWAQSLADGSILLAENALSFCYSGDDLKRGDARLAFVLGHELAHQLNGDFWHFFFYRNDTDKKNELKQIKEIIKDPEVFKMRELQADQYGIIYASLAGFDIEPVVSKDSSLFEEWARMIGASSGSVIKSDYPLPEERTKALRTRLEEVVNRLGFFDMGVICYRLGWYDEALALFEEFVRYYPGREVYTNIGTVYLSKAINHLRTKSAEDSFPFAVYFGVAPYTRAEAIKVSKKTESEHGRKKEIDDLLDKAIYNLEKAVAGDSLYYLSKNNLGCANLIKGNYHEAIALFEEAQNLKPGNSGIINNIGIAYFLLGKRLDNDGLKQEGFKRLEKALDKKHPFLQAKYNLSLLNIKAKNDNSNTGEIMDYSHDDSLIFPDFQEIKVKIKPNSPFSRDILQRLGRVKKEELSASKTNLVYMESEDKSIKILLKNNIINLAVYRVSRKGNDSSDLREIKIDLSEKKGVMLKDGYIKSYFEYQ